MAVVKTTLRTTWPRCRLKRTYGNPLHHRNTAAISPFCGKLFCMQDNSQYIHQKKTFRSLTCSVFFRNSQGQGLSFWKNFGLPEHTQNISSLWRIDSPGYFAKYDVIWKLWIPWASYSLDGGVGGASTFRAVDQSLMGNLRPTGHMRPHASDLC